MKAMILAAGLGTRLRPLTQDRPKALVKLNGHTLLELTLARMRDFGIRDVIVNTHAFAGQIADYLAANRNFGMNIAISRETDLLDTGGGLKRADHFFTDETGPFLLHNVDVISTIDLHAMLRAHNDGNALATLAVQQRTNSRPLLLDDSNLLRGCRTPDGEIWAREKCECRELAFAGIHFLSPRIVSLLPPQEKFSIISAYLVLAAAGERIVAFEQNDAYWADLGTPQSLAEAAKRAGEPETKNR